MQKDVKAMEDKMNKALQKQRQIHLSEMQNTKVRFPTHTTNVYHSTAIQPSAVLISSDSFPNFTSL